MESNSEQTQRIRNLRLRMGWSESDLAKKLATNANDLFILEQQAEEHSEIIIESALAETILEETHEQQIHCASVKRHFFENS